MNNPRAVLTLDQNQGYPRIFEGATSKGQLQSSWKDNQDGLEVTECWYSNGDYWISQAGFGEIHFTATDQVIKLYPKKNVDSEFFRSSVAHYWLPLVYQVWGLLALHASAVVHNKTGQALLFVGKGEAGKSTIAYGIGKYPGWQQIADDSVALSVRGVQIEMSYIPNEVKLRQPSAHFFGSENPSTESIKWPSYSPSPKAIYWIDPIKSGKTNFSIDRMGIGQAYLKLLEHSYFFTEKLSEQTRKSGEKILELANQVPVYRIIYPQEFIDFQPLLSAIQDHAA